MRQRGFTIVELLIVVVVIAILAAITIVAYNGIQSRATESAVQADLRNAMAKLQNYKTLNGVYPDNSDSSLALAEVKASSSLYRTGVGNFLYCGDNTTSRTVVGIIVVAKNGVTYAMATNRPFAPYTAYPTSSYAAACTDLTGNSSARYGYDGTVWRSWVGI